MTQSCCRPALCVKIIATIEFIGCIFSLILITLLMIDISFEEQISASVANVLGLTREIQFLVLYIFWTIMFITLLLNVNLFRGATRKSYEACRIWQVVNCSTFIMTYVWSVMSANLLWNFGRLTFSAFVVFGLYRGYTIMVVYRLLQSIKEEKVPQIATIALPALPLPPNPLVTDDLQNHNQNNLILHEKENYSDEIICISAPPLSPRFLTAPSSPMGYPDLGEFKTFTGK